jgi:hypothetical protein
VTEDGHIVVTGEWRDYAANNVMRMFLAKYTADLEEVWTRYYPDFAETSLYSDRNCGDRDRGLSYSIYPTEVDPSYSETKSIENGFVWLPVLSGYVFA